MLGSILIDPGAFVQARSIIKREDFYIEKHAWIFEAMEALHGRGEPLDFLTINGEVEKAKKQEGLSVYIVALMNAVPTAIHVKKYAQEVKEQSVRRQLVSTAGEIAGYGYNEPEVLGALTKAQSALAKIRIGNNGTFQTAQEIGADTEEMMKHRFENPTDIFGLATGFRALDDAMGGFEPESLTILAGRPGMGKSALGLGITKNVALLGKPVVYFSLEMANRMNFLRLVSMSGGYNLHEVKRGKKKLEGGLWRKWSDDEQADFWHDYFRAETLPIFFNDASGITTAEATAAAAEVLMDRNVALVVFDYLGLAGDRGESRVQQVGTISRGLKHMASMLKVPVLVMAQLNRSVEGRDDKRPALSDLRDSGDVEQDADNVIFLYRAKYYYPTEEDWNKAHRNLNYPGNVTEAIVAKQRNGPAPITSLLYFDDTHLRFMNLEGQNAKSIYGGGL